MENKFRAVRYGLQGKLIDFGKEQEVPECELILEYLNFIEEDVDELGSRDAIEHIREMIRVGLLIDRLEGRVRHVVEIASLLIGGCVVGFFTYYAVMLTYDSWRFNDMAQGVLPVPLWIPQLGYAGGLLILLVALVDEFVHVVRGNIPRYEKPKPQTAEEVVEQAIQSGV